MNDEELVAVEVPRARDAFRRGVPPSQIVEPLQRDGWGSIRLVLLGMRAFRLSIGECKEAEGWSHRGIDARPFDAYFRPLIERNRHLWDH
jgi:hypothetical protein